MKTHEYDIRRSATLFERDYLEIIIDSSLLFIIQVPLKEII